MPEIRFPVRRADDEDGGTNRARSAAPRPPLQLRVPQEHSRPPAARRRGAYRQRLIDAEHGLRMGLRMDGTLFVHLFVTCCVLAAGFVLGLSAQQWAVVSLAIALVITTETFNQMLRALWAGIGHHLPADVRDVVRIGAAAVLLSSIGAGAAIVLVFADRLRS